MRGSVTVGEFVLMLEDLLFAWVAVFCWACLAGCSSEVDNSTEVQWSFVQLKWNETVASWVVCSVCSTGQDSI